MLADIFQQGAVLDRAQDLFNKGGSLMWVLLVLSFFAVMLIFVNLWMTRGNAVLPMHLIRSVELAIRRKDFTGAIDLCEDNDSSFTRTLQVMLEFLRRTPNATIKDVTDVAEVESARQLNMLTRKTSWLADIGGLAPMVGLLGTVLGMMRTFHDISSRAIMEGAKQMEMANGIYVAMITTVGGLVLAIPCLLAYAFFRNRIQKHVTDMQVTLTHILSLLSVQMNREQRSLLTKHNAANVTREVLPGDDPVK